MPFGATRKTPVVFYQTATGKTPVLDWLKSLSPEVRAVIGQDLMRVQFRWPVGMPLCRSLGDGRGQPNRSAIFFPRRRQDHRAARLHQEDTTDAGPGPETGTPAQA